MIVGAVLAPLATTAVWLHGLVLNTDRYVAAVGPIITNPVVREAVASRAVDELIDTVNLERRLFSVLPSDTAFLAPTLTAALRQTAIDATVTLLGTKKVGQLWRTANRLAHDQLVRLLRAHLPSRESTKNLVLDIAPIVKAARAELAKRGITFVDSIPDSVINGQFVLMASNALHDAQDLTAWLDRLALWLPIATIVAFAGALVVAPDRRRALLTVAVGLAGGMVALMVGLAIGRSYYLHAVEHSVDRNLAAVPFDALAHRLKLVARLEFAGAAVAAIVVWLTGASHVAVQMRDRAALLARRGRDPAAAFAGGVSRHVRALRVVGLAGAASFLVFRDDVGAGEIIGVAVGTLVYLVVLEIVDVAGAARVT